MGEKKPEKNHSKKGRKTASFCLHHPIPQDNIAQHRELPARMRSPHRERRSGLSDPLPQPLGASYTGPTEVAPHPDTGKAETYTARNKEEEQWLPEAGT